VIISPAHFKYLYVQRGEVADVYQKQGFEAWKAAYEASLARIMRSITGYLPAECGALLDVGSGLGGIDVLLSRRYEHKVLVCTIDGADSPPVVNVHRLPFNNQLIQADFLHANGVQRQHHYSPDFDQFEEKFDLLVSFASWCFHYPPEEYLDRIRVALNPGATVILDVRTSAVPWHDTLRKAFGDYTVLCTTNKLMRLAWKLTS